MTDEDRIHDLLRTLRRISTHCHYWQTVHKDSGLAFLVDREVRTSAPSAVGLGPPVNYSLQQLVKDVDPSMRAVSLRDLKLLLDAVAFTLEEAEGSDNAKLYLQVMEKAAEVLERQTELLA